MRRIVAVTAIMQPAFARPRIDQAVFGGMPEDVLERESVNLEIAGKLWTQAFPQQFTALLQHQIELLDGRPCMSQAMLSGLWRAIF